MFPTFYIFNIPVPSYFFCAVLGFSAAITLAFFRNINSRVKWSAYYLFILFAALGMLAGSKILFFITAIPGIIDDFSFVKAIITFANGGFVFYGGLFGALTGGAISSKISKEDLRELYNVFVPPIILFHTFGRIGCFCAGCCYGIEFPIGFAYPSEPGIIRLPVQLAEAVGNLIIILILLYREYGLRKKDKLAVMYLLMYAPMRFLLEFFRGDDIRGIWLFMSTSQWISLIVIFIIFTSALKRKTSIKSSP